MQAPGVMVLCLCRLLARWCCVCAGSWRDDAVFVQAPGVLVLYLLVSGSLLTRCRRPMSRLTAEEQRLEGELRYVNSRLITNCEEIAFYGGNLREKKTIDSAFARLVSCCRAATTVIILIIIIYHDFLPTPRRGSLVKSGKTHTQSSRYTP